MALPLIGGMVAADLVVSAIQSHNANKERNKNAPGAAHFDPIGTPHAEDVADHVYKAPVWLVPPEDAGR